MLVPDDMKVYLYNEVTDMRKSINTLSILVADVLELDPCSGHLFLFRNRTGDKLKALYYEPNAFTLVYRRLEKGKFIFPKDTGGKIEMTKEHFKWLLASDRYARMSCNTPECYTDFY